LSCFTGGFKKQNSNVNTMRPFATLLILLHCHLVDASHFRFGTVSWSAVEESYPCTDGEHGPAAIDTPCHLPFTHDNQMHMGCTGHNTTTGSASTDVCTNTCRYPNDQMCDDGGPDIFVHHKGLLMEGRRMLDVGQRVEFDEKPGERLEAVQVRVVTMRPPTTTTSLPTRAATSLIPRAVARRAATGSSSSKRQATDAAPAAAPASKRRTTGPGASKAALKDRRSECG
jgi:cold shock CspA family protein